MDQSPSYSTSSCRSTSLCRRSSVFILSQSPRGIAADLTLSLLNTDRLRYTWVRGWDRRAERDASRRAQSVRFDHDCVRAHRARDRFLHAREVLFAKVGQAKEEGAHVDLATRPGRTRILVLTRDSGLERTRRVEHACRGSTPLVCPNRRVVVSDFPVLAWKTRQIVRTEASYVNLHWGQNSRLLPFSPTPPLALPRNLSNVEPREVISTRLLPTFDAPRNARGPRGSISSRQLLRRRRREEGIVETAQEGGPFASDVRIRTVERVQHGSSRDSRSHTRLASLRLEPGGTLVQF